MLKAKKFKDTFASVTEIEDSCECIISRGGSSVLDKSVFDAADVYNLLENLENTLALPPNGIPSIFFEEDLLHR